MTTILLAQLLQPAVFLVVALTRVLRRHRGERQLLLAASCASFSAALLVDADTVYTRVDTFVGRPNAANLITHILFVIGAALFYSFYRPLLVQTPGVKARSLVPVTGAACAAMAYLFLRRPLPVETPSGFTDVYGGRWDISLYWLLTLAYLAGLTLALARGGIRPAKRSALPELRATARLLQVGAATGWVYVAAKTVQLVTVEAAGPGTALSRAAQTVGATVRPFWLACVAASLVVGPTWRMLRAVRRTTGAIAATRMLRPLWNDLRIAAPNVVLDSPRRSALTDFNPRGAQGRLYRREIEIHDALLWLQPHLEATSEAPAPGDHLPRQLARRVRALEPDCRAVGTIDLHSLAAKWREKPRPTVH